MLQTFVYINLNINANINKLNINFILTIIFKIVGVAVVLIL